MSQISPQYCDGLEQRIKELSAELDAEREKVKELESLNTRLLDVSETHAIKDAAIDALGQRIAELEAEKAERPSAADHGELCEQLAALRHKLEMSEGGKMESLFRVGDTDHFFRWSFCGLYLAKRYCSPASKWFGHIAWRLYFRKWWVTPANCAKRGDRLNAIQRWWNKPGDEVAEALENAFQYGRQVGRKECEAPHIERGEVK